MAPKPTRGMYAGSKSLPRIRLVDLTSEEGLISSYQECVKTQREQKSSYNVGEQERILRDLERTAMSTVRDAKEELSKATGLKLLGLHVQSDSDFGKAQQRILKEIFPEFYEGLAYFYGLKPKSQSMRQAIRVFENVAKKAEDQEALLAAAAYKCAGDAWYAESKKIAAIDAYKKAFHLLKIIPTRSIENYNLADEFKKMKDQLQLCDAPQEFIQQVDAEYHKQLGERYRKNNNFAAALTEYETVARLSPTEIDALLLAVTEAKKLQDKKGEPGAKVSSIIAYLRIAAQRIEAQKNPSKALRLNEEIRWFKRDFSLDEKESERIDEILSPIRKLITEAELKKQYESKSENKSVSLEQLAQQNYLPAIHDLAKQCTERKFWVYIGRAA